MFSLWCSVTFLGNNRCSMDRTCKGNPRVNEKRILVPCKNKKKCIVPSLEVIKSDITIIFSVVYLIHKQGLIDEFSLGLPLFFGGWNRKLGCLYRNSASNWMIEFKRFGDCWWWTIHFFYFCRLSKNFLIKWSPHCAHVIRVRGYEFVQQVKANKFCSDIPQIDLSKMLRANDIEKLPVINDLNAKQMENFCHNLLSDIACKSKIHDIICGIQ